MDIKPICINDSTFYGLKAYPQIADYLCGLPDICVVYADVFQFKFTGVVILNEVPVIVFPKNYTVPVNTDEKYKHAATYVKALLRYRNEPFHEDEEQNLLYGFESDNARIVTAFQLIEDYLSYGILERERVIFTESQKDRTDWNTTINKTIPIVNHRQVIYNRPISRIKEGDESNLIHRLHYFVIRECLKMWGWLYEVYCETIPREYEELPCLREKAITTLYQELKETYIQREISVIKNLISYLLAESGQSNSMNKEILGTQYFSYVWEAICGYLFRNKYATIRDIVPQPEWEGIKGKISQRPDILTVDGSTLYVLDAKYYNYNVGLPGWHDVVKQMFYKHTITENLQRKRVARLLPNVKVVKNAFLFPGDENEQLKYIGRVFVRDIDDLGEVKAFAINQWDAIRTYAFRNDDQYRDDLLTTLKVQC